MEGLIDAASSEDFDTKLASMKLVWESRESGEPTCTPGFFQWFQTYKAKVFRCSVIRPVREEARLGSPPEVFTTNASESLNAAIKSKVNYQKSELNKFIDKMRCLETDQQKEVERAVCGRGKYRLRPQYRSLEVEEQTWFNMTPEARRKHMAKINRLSVTPDDTSEGELSVQQPDVPVSSGVATGGMLEHDRGASRTLSVELASFEDTVLTPNAVLHGIWKKAEEIVSDPNKISVAPGCSTLARMVASKTGKRPHLVTPGCDGECPNYKSFGICSHVVATAEANRMLPAFIEYFKKQKKVPKLTSLAKSGLPSGRGRKGGQPPRKRKKSTPAEERVPFNPLTMGASSVSSVISDGSSGSQVGTSSHVGTSSVWQQVIVPQGIPLEPSPQKTRIPPHPLPHYGGTSQAAFCMSNQFIQSSATPALQPPSHRPLASPPPLLPFHQTVANFNTPEVAHGDCNVVVSPTSMHAAGMETILS